jgi:amino acid transporter
VVRPSGIFVLTGTVAAKNAGPAVVISFIVAGTFVLVTYSYLAFVS